jgi:hypothetical protein
MRAASVPKKRTTAHHRRPLRPPPSLRATSGGSVEFGIAVRLHSHGVHTKEGGLTFSPLRQSTRS